MPWQLIYTSAPRGLLSGQSGFCTVARSADLRAALVQRLEQISSYHYLRVAEAATANRNPTVSAFRLLDLRGAKYYVLTRILPCGLDFTARTNHLAHHLVFQPDELAALPSPAALLRHWPGWMKSWQGEPRVLEEIDAAGFASAAKSFLPAQTWARMTGDGGRAAGLLESECVRGCYLVCPPGSEEQVLEMYCETLALLNPDGRFPLRPWRHGFTTFLQAEDNPNDFQWRGCQENTPAFMQAMTRSAPMIPLRSVRVPANDLVKRAREGPKPPPAPTPAPSGPAPTATQPLRVERSTRTTAALSPQMDSVNIKKPLRSEKPAFLDLNFSIHSATLARVGIFAAVLVVLLLVRIQLSKPPAEQATPAPAPGPNAPPVVAPPPKPLAVAALDAKQLHRLVGDGPTYILAVPSLAHFSLPIHSIIRLQNLLHRYDKLETLPNVIQLTAETDRWDFPPGVSMTVRGRKEAPQFSASAGGLDCVLDYSEWLAGKEESLAVQANFDRVPGAFSIHFGFSSANDGDPFRLLIVNENNPPAPLALARGFVQDDRQEVGASLTDPMRECLFTNFELLAGRQWQLQPFIKPKTRPARYLYKDWPAQDRPAFGCELDFANIRKRLGAQRQDFTKRLDSLSRPLGLPLGKWLEFTNASLENFLAFSSGDLTAGAFLAYLDKLKKSAPEKSWIKNWHNQFDSDQPDEVSAKLQELFNLWNENRSQDQRLLTVTNASGPTNYFFDAWQRLKEAESVQDHLGKVQKRLVELDHVAYVGLCIVDPRQPGTRLEMIRFEGP
jgi:hypothetical protein